MESIHIETDLELSEIAQYFRTSEVCPTLLHSSSCILIGCFARPKIVGKQLLATWGVPSAEFHICIHHVKIIIPSTNNAGCRKKIIASKSP